MRIHRRRLFGFLAPSLPQFVREILQVAPIRQRDALQALAAFADPSEPLGCLSQGVSPRPVTYMQ